MSDLVAGTMITENIRLSRKLGEGGMGSVWVADHLRLETEVAVKFVSREFAQNEDLRARFSREASASAKIKSPHVVQVFDHGETQGIPFIVMELLTGEDLAEKVNRENVLSARTFLPILRQVCKGLAKAHQAGVVHRDIKPANIFLVDSDGELFVKILDFGIAKSSSKTSHSMTQTGSMLGTPYYMSPEQIISPKEVDLRADLWALAVVTYEVLSGQLPFDGETLGAIHIAISSSRYKPFSTHCPGLRSLDPWFARAFNVDRDRRFLSAKEFADTFAEALPAEMRSLLPQRESVKDFPVVSVPPPALERATFETIATNGPEPIGAFGAVGSADAQVTEDANSRDANRAPRPVRPGDNTFANSSFDTGGGTKRRSNKWMLVGGVLFAGASAVGGGAMILRANKAPVPVVPSSPVVADQPRVIPAPPPVAVEVAPTSTLGSPAASASVAPRSHTKVEEKRPARPRNKDVPVVPKPVPVPKDRGF